MYYFMCYHVKPFILSTLFLCMIVMYHFCFSLCLCVGYSYLLLYCFKLIYSSFVYYTVRVNECLVVQRLSLLVCSLSITLYYHNTYVYIYTLLQYLCVSNCGLYLFYTEILVAVVLLFLLYQLVSVCCFVFLDTNKTHKRFNCQLPHHMYIYI